MRAVELFYTVSEIALLLKFSERWVAQKIAAGEFGDPASEDGPVQIGDSPGNGDWRIPASQVNAYIARCRPLTKHKGPISARSIGELRRKVAASAA